MKRKISIILLILVSILMITGCNQKEKGNQNNNKNKEKVKIGEVSADLSAKASFNGLDFNYPESANIGNVGTYSLIDYMYNDELIVKIGIYYFEGKTIGEVLQGSTLASAGVVTYNGIMWNIYSGQDDEGNNVINYASQIKSDSYTITFLSQKDSTDFATEFMKNVKLSAK